MTNPYPPEQVDFVKKLISDKNDLLVALKSCAAMLELYIIHHKGMEAAKASKTLQAARAAIQKESE